VWRGSHGQFPWKDSPGRPRWLNEDPRENPNSRLWDAEPAAQQFTSAEAAGDDEGLVPPQSDLKTLARLFATVLTGRVERDIVAPNAAPVWGVLRAVLKGDIKTADHFRERLREHHLSQHWLAPKGPKTNSRAVPILGALALLGIVGGVVLLLAYGDRFRNAATSGPDSSVAAATSKSTARSTKQNAGPAHPLDKTE